MRVTGIKIRNHDPKIRNIQTATMNILTIISIVFTILDTALAVSVIKPPNSQDYELLLQCLNGTLLTKSERPVHLKSAVRKIQRWKRNGHLVSLGKYICLFLDCLFLFVVMLICCNMDVLLMCY